MIVRDEAPTVGRCLASVTGLIDEWAIVDTGSTDGTQEIVRQALREKPGALIERPWVDFSHNRNQALGLASGRCDYVLVIDADEVLRVDEDFSKRSLTRDAYYLEVAYENVRYRRKLILRDGLPWRYEGVLHEHVRCGREASERDAVGLRIEAHHDGARARDPLTYRRDALVLETALLEEPDNPRHVFYLAQSYRDAGEPELAIRNYRRRAEMGGWDAEAWYCLYQIALLRERMGEPWGSVMEDYLRAFQRDPRRAEPLLRVALRCEARGEFHLARMFLGHVLRLPTPSREHLFVERDVYDYRLALEYAASCAGAGEHAEAISVCNGLLLGGALPVESVPRVRRIRDESARGLQPPAVPAADPPRLRVCLPFRDPGLDFDECLESLLLQDTPLLQDPASLEVTLIDDASRPEHRERLPPAREGWRVLRNERPLGLERCIAALVAECDPEDVVVVLAGTRGFADRRAAGRVLACFEDRECRLLYGQHRLASGAPGDAVPAAGADDLARAGASLTSRSPVFFRARLWRDGGVTGVESSQERTEQLLRGAGFRGTRFLDAVLTVAGDDAEPVPAAPEPARTRRTGGIEGMREAPPVSCLMVTRDRVALARRAIRCFAEQTYPHRELVVVCDGEARIRLALERFATELGVENARFLYPDGEGLPLGALRNMAIDAAAGSVVCQWDDDDCYHPERLGRQLRWMLDRRARACLLTDHLHYLEDDGALLWVDWRLGRDTGPGRLMPGSLMMSKQDGARYPEAGPYARRGEDSVLLSALHEAGDVAALEDHGHLYLYAYHGRNTFEKAHHTRLASVCRTVSELQERTQLIRDAMAHYPVAKPYLVLGRDGPAFTLAD